MKCINLYKNFRILDADKPRAKELGRGRYVLYEKDTDICNIVINKPYKPQLIYYWYKRHGNIPDYTTFFRAVGLEGNANLNVSIHFMCISLDADWNNITENDYTYVEYVFNGATGFVSYKIEEPNKLPADLIQSDFESEWWLDWNGSPELPRYVCDITFSDPDVLSYFLNDALPYDVATWEHDEYIEEPMRATQENIQQMIDAFTASEN